MKKCTAAIGIREMQTKVMLKVCVTTVRMVIMKTNKQECWQECEEKFLLHCWHGYKVHQPLWKTVWRFFKKTKIELLYNLAISCLNIQPKEK